MINVDDLPTATDADLERVGQYLHVRHSNVILRIDRRVLPNAVVVAAVGDWVRTLGNAWSATAASNYRLLTEAQAIELAKAMPHVHAPWKATWPKDADTIPAFADVCVGDSFDRMGEHHTVVDICVNYAGPVIWTDKTRARSTFITREMWECESSNNRITNYRAKVDAGERILEKMAEVAREQIQSAVHPGYAPKGGPPHMAGDISEARVEFWMQQKNDAYAERMERDRKNILREMLKPYQANSNGLGSLSCIMRARRQ